LKIQESRFTIFLIPLQGYILISHLMKEKIKKLLTNPISLSFIAAIIVIIGLFWGTLRWLDSYTNHGEEVIVPDLEGLEVAEAEKMLADKKLRYEINDSLYVRNKKPGVIVEQNPVPGSRVKEERKIYVILNARSPRQIALPDLRDVSVRQAEATLNSIGLKVENYEYVPSEYKDLVQDVKYKGNVVAPGTRITDGAAVILMVGIGLSDEQTNVVSFRGLTLEQAIQKAHSSFLNIGATRYDVPPVNDADKAKYIVYRQEPISNSKVPLGQAINLFLSKDRKLLDTPEEVADTVPVITEEETEDLWR
jgi:beta-lactam-binding protein with PASTA domain